MLLVLAISLALSAQALEQHSQTMTDAQNAGLRGKVKSCAEEQTFLAVYGQPERTTSTTTEYAAEGKLLSRRTLYSQGSEYSFSRIYDSHGRLTKELSGSAEKQSEKIYQYDPTGRLLSWTMDGKPSDTSYRYEDSGRKIQIQRPEAGNFPPDTAMAFSMEGSEIGRSIPPGGTLTTIYDDRDQPIEGQIRDAEGHVIIRIVRRYDSNARVISEEHVSESPELALPAELRSRFNDAQLRSVGAWVASNLGSMTLSYSYDSEGRLTGKRNHSGESDTTTTIRYNEHGDKLFETEVTVRDPAAQVGYSVDDDGNMVPQATPKAQPAIEGENRYEYQYDLQGNWTEMKVSSRPGANDPFLESEIRHRQLIYY